MVVVVLCIGPLLLNVACSPERPVHLGRESGVLLVV